MFVLIFPLYGNTSIPQAPRFSSASPIRRKAKTSGRCKHTVALYRRAAGNTQRQRITLAVRIQESPAFWSVGCLKHKSESFRLRFVLFTAVYSAGFPLFPSGAAPSNPILGQKWVKISSQAVFKVGMSFTRVFHTEGMPISHLIQGGLVSHPYEGTCCRITLYPIGCAHDIFPRSD